VHWVFQKHEENGCITWITVLFHRLNRFMKTKR